MKLLWAHVKVDLLSLQRRPMSVFASLILPGLLFLFDIPHAKDQTAANMIMTAMTIFAVLGITFFQFGVAIAAARGSPWELTLRTLPLAPWIRFAARVLVAQISPSLPTRRYVEVVWAPVLGQAWRVADWLWLLGYTAAFGFLAIWGYQRDESERFR